MNIKQYTRHLVKEFGAKEDKEGVVGSDGVRFRINTLHEKEDVAVQRMEDGEEVTVIETRSTPTDRLAVYVKGEAVFLLVQGTAVDTEARDAEIRAALAPLPGEAVDKDADERYSAIGMMPMKSNSERMQLVRLDIVHGRVVNREPLFGHEPERNAFAMSRLTETFIPNIAVMLNDGGWARKSKEPSDG